MAAASPVLPPSAQPLPPKESYTAAPVVGSASAATSFSVLFRQPLGERASERCQDGLASSELHPEVVEAHAVSAHPRLLKLLRLSVVPPTEVTNGSAAGNVGPYPVLPAAKTIATPGWL